MGSKIITIVFFSLAIGILLRTIFLLWNHTFPDFSVYHASAQTALQGGNPYIHTSAGMNFLYPLPALFLFLPFSFLSLQNAGNMWLVSSVCFLIVSFIYLQKIQRSSSILMSILLLGLVISFPFKFSLGMGQINIFVLCMLVLFIYSYEKKYALRMGGYLAAAILTKVSPIYIFIVLCIHKKWIFALYTISFLMLLSFGGLLLFSPSISIYFFSNIMELIKNSPGGVYYNQSITGLGARLLISSAYIVVIQLISGLVSLGLVWRKQLSMLSFSFIITTMLLVSTITWQHHLVLLLIPFYYFLSHKQPWQMYVFLFFAYCLVSTNIKEPAVYVHTWYTWFILSHGTIGVLLLWILQAVSLFRQKKYEK